VHADIDLSASYIKYWTAEFIEACEGLRASDRPPWYTNCVKAASPLPLQDFVVDLRDAHKLAAYHAWMASPLKPRTARGPPHLLPRYKLLLRLLQLGLEETAHLRESYN